MKLIGFNSGVLYHSVHPISKEVFEIIQKTGSNALEISCSETDRVNKLRNLESSDFQDFSYVSLHAPSNKVYKNDRETREILDSIQERHNKLNFACVVFHPDIVEDWHIFNSYNFPIAIENMDRQKNSGKTVKDMQQVFSKKNYKFVLDINHCYSNDKSLKLVKDFYKNFKDILCEVHLSGFIKRHEPLFITKQTEILQALPKENIPIIIESVCENDLDLHKELAFINKFLLENC